jgi:hypothetical protein
LRTSSRPRFSGRTVALATEFDTTWTIGIATEPLSRDHLKVAVPVGPASWISTRYV